jgi:hypothetical protein
VPFETFLKQQGVSPSITRVFTDSVASALELSGDREFQVVKLSSLHH